MRKYRGRVTVKNIKACSKYKFGDLVKFKDIRSESITNSSYYVLEKHFIGGNLRTTRIRHSGNGNRLIVNADIWGEGFRVYKAYNI